MAPPPIMTMMLLVVMVPAKLLAAESNEIDYGFWNYREGSDNVNVASVRSMTRVLDVWGKRIFNEIKHMLLSQPSALLPDYSRVRPLSESLNDLFKEVTLLQKRITELTNRLATLEPYLRRHGYREEVGRVEGRGVGRALPPQSMRGGGASFAKYPPRYRARVRPVNIPLRRRRVKVYRRVGGQARDR
ncbi:uncharacterized protein [Paramormyrops kingsleyae]|uniref:Si:ch211-243a20.3 n=1 Tax=Paramormyrops kingsleyae TaxID=1676925 RepID=A0A3B3RDU1_9TELE